MAIDIETIDSPGWWAKKLADQLASESKQLNLLHDWFRGCPPLPDGAENMRKAYQAFQRLARANYGYLSVVALLHRLKLVGFKTSAPDDANGDLAAGKIWSGSGMKLGFSEVLMNCLSMGRGYIIVGGTGENGDIPVLTSEDPRQVISIHDPIDDRIVRAALKLYWDCDYGRSYAYIYLPGKRYVAVMDSKRAMARFHRGWAWDESRGGVEGEDLPHDRVPVVRLQNRLGMGEFEPHLPVLQRINHEILQRMVIATMQAFRQRAARGELPTEDHLGRPIDWEKELEADPGGVWLLPGVVEMWESGQVDLTPILSAIKESVREFAAVTETPMSVFQPESGNQSAEGASLSREGLVFRAEDLIERASETARDALALAFLVKGDIARADRTMIDPMWAPVERISVNEKASAGAQAAASGLPWRWIMKDIWGYPPTAIAEMEADKAMDALLAPPVPAEAETEPAAAA